MVPSIASRTLARPTASEMMASGDSGIVVLLLVASNVTRSIEIR